MILNNNAELMLRKSVGSYLTPKAASGQATESEPLPKSDDRFVSSGNTSDVISSSEGQPDERSTKNKPPREKVEQVKILHINDLHGMVVEEPGAEDGKIGGLARIAGGIRELRCSGDQCTILLDGGDFFEGSFYSKFSQGQIVSKPYEKIGFDAIAIGNHDVNWGFDALARIREDSNTSFLSANLRDLSSDKKAERLYEPFKIIEREGLKIGILGLTCPETETSTRQRGEVAVLDPFATARDFVGKLKDKVDILVVLSHLGYSEDIKLAKSAEGIHIIVGSHSHTTLEKVEKVGNTLIAQAGEYGKHIGEIDFSFDREKKVILSHNSRLVPVTKDIPVDREVESIISSHVASLDRLKSQVIGYAGEDLVNFKCCEGGANTNLTNLFIDLQRKDSDIALSSTFALRKGLNRGPITFETLYEAHPFERTLMQVRTKGSQVLEFLEDGLADKNQVNGKIFSGLTYEYCGERKEGERIVSIDYKGKRYTREEFSKLDLTATMDSYIYEKKCFRACEIVKNYGDVFTLFKEHVQTMGTLKDLPCDVRYRRVSDPDIRPGDSNDGAPPKKTW